MISEHPVARPATRQRVAGAGRLAPSVDRLERSAAAPWVIIAALTLIGAAIRVVLARKGLFADELSTFWIITADRAGAGLPTLHGLGGVISLVGHVYPDGQTSEISPPGYFVAAWLTTQFGHSPELVRAPSLLAGAATIPVIYLLGLRTVGRVAALIAAGLTALSPFMIYYSSEARAYSLMTFFVTLAALAMLSAVDTRRLRWWVVYALSSAAAVYCHYTCVFVLAAQAIWVLWAHPEARKPALLANAGALVLYVPWIPGTLNEFNSPTTKILSALSPFTPGAVRGALEQWVIGFPFSNVKLRTIPGTPALIMLGIAAIVTVVALAARGARGRLRHHGADRRLVLVLLLAVSVPLGEAVFSAVSTHMFTTRNLASATPGVFLLTGAAIAATGPRARYAVAALTLAAFAIGAVKMLDPAYQRPNTPAAAAFVEHNYRPGDVIVDDTASFTPGPLSPLDSALRPGLPVFRGGAPQERDHPFTLSDRVVRQSEAVSAAVAAAHGHRIFVVTGTFSSRSALLAVLNTAKLTGGVPAQQRLLGEHTTASDLRRLDEIPATYHLVAQRTFAGLPGVSVRLYAR